MIKKPLLTISGLALLIAVMGSCKKDVQSVAPTTSTTTEPKTNFAGVVDGRTISINESSMASTYYSGDGDGTTALMTTNTLTTAGDQLVFFIADVKNGKQTVTKKLGTSSNPGNPALRVNSSTGTVSNTTQTYIKYVTTGKNTFYAISGTVDITITGKNVTVKWDIKFMNSISGEFPSTGTYTVLNYTANPKAKSGIIDPTPLTLKPTIENMSPLSGSAGDTVTLNGVNYSTAATENSLKFNGTVAKITFVSATKMLAIVPKQGMTGAVTLSVKNSEVCTGPNFTYVEPATLTSFAPAVAKAGDTIVIKGTHFSTTATDDVVKVKGIAAKVITASANQISAVVPTGTATGRITVTIGSHNLTSATDLILANGLAWQDLGFTAPIANYNQAVTLGTTTIFAGGFKSNYLYVTKNGTSFTNVYESLPFNKVLLELKLVAANDSAFFVTTNYGIAKSTDGIKWTKLTPNPNNPNMSFNGIVAMGNSVSVVNSNVLYKSTDSGVTWTTYNIVSQAGIDYITSDAAGKYWFAVDVAANLPNNTARKFYKSTDQGKTWSATKGATGYYMYGFGQQEYLKAHNSAGVFILYSPPSTSPSLADQRLYKSTNQGDGWSKVTDEAVYVVKVTGNEVMYGGLTFNLAKDGNNYTKYLAPAGYTIYGAEKSNGYYYIFATNNTTSAHKIFRAVVQ
jgi:hypothetical protein